MLRPCVVAPLFLCGLALVAAPAGARLLLNEVLYDPEGPDEGFEFVEVWNPDSVAVTLDGVALEAGDGSRPGVWTPVFAGAAGDTVPPRAPFLIPASSLRGALQNGPDALRLTRGGDVQDLLGYGALTAPELYRGSPAADAPSGSSLARVRDGEDTGSNAADWAAEPEPTPGRANHPDVALALRSAGLDPEVPWPEQPAFLSLQVRNRGRLPVEASRWLLEISLPGSAVATLPGLRLAPGESASLRCPWTAPGTPGRVELRAVLRDLAGSAIADTATIAARVGAGPLLLNEIAFHDRGAGEWVEVLARDALPDLGAFALADATGRRFDVDRGPSTRGAVPGEILVLAESPDRVRAAYALPESLVLGCRGGWPSLNDTEDRVRLLEATGLLSDAVSYRAESTERGASLERLGASLPSGSADSWTECIDPKGGTPGRPNSMRAASPSPLLLLASPRVLRRPRGGPVAPVVLSFGASARGVRARVLVHDLLGRTRRHLVDGQRVTGEAAFVWDGRDDDGVPVPAGAYVARAETIPDGAEPARSGNLALTVVDR